MIFLLCKFLLRVFFIVVVYKLTGSIGYTFLIVGSVFLIGFLYNLFLLRGLSVKNFWDFKWQKQKKQD